MQNVEIVTLKKMNDLLYKNLSFFMSFCPLGANEGFVPRLWCAAGDGKVFR